MSGQFAKVKSRTFGWFLAVGLALCIAFVLFIGMFLRAGRVRSEYGEVDYDRNSGEPERVSYADCEIPDRFVLAPEEVVREVRIYYKRSPISLELTMFRKGIGYIVFERDPAKWEKFVYFHPPAPLSDFEENLEDPDSQEIEYMKQSKKFAKQMGDYRLPDWRLESRTAILIPGLHKSVRLSEAETKAALEPYIDEIRALADALEAAMLEEEIAAE